MDKGSVALSRRPPPPPGFFYTEISTVSGNSDSSSLNKSVSDNAQLDLQHEFKRALSLHRAGDLSAAALIYEQILCAFPDHAGATHFLGMTHFARGDLTTALQLIERSLVIMRSNSVYWNNYGVVLLRAERPSEARSAFEHALTIRPDYADASANIGLACMQLHDQDHVVEYHLNRALAISPDHADALEHLTRLRARQHRISEVFALTKRRAERNLPTASELHHLGTLAGDCCEIEDSKEYFRNASKMPGGRPEWRWKHLWYCPTFFATDSEMEEYWQNLNRDLDEAISERPRYDWRTLFSEGFTHSFNLPHLNRCCRDVLEKYEELFAPSFSFERPSYASGNRIRVGFMVTPGHENGFIRLTSGIISQLDRNRFDVVLFHHESASLRFEALFSDENVHRVPYSWNPEETVQKLRDIRCDVIYHWKVAADLWSTFLPMCGLAPRQFTSWGTHGTSGMKQIDRYISWDRAEVLDAQQHYTERLYLMRSAPFCEPIPSDLPSRATRSELGLPETGAIYFCPHRVQKYHPIFDRYLCEILERDRTGHVVLLTGNRPDIAEKLKNRMRNAIGEPLFSRVIMLPSQSVDSYYRYLSASTVILQSPIYSGEITTVDGFLYGVPSVTQTGELLIQRYTSAFYDEAGITGLTATSREDYVSLAVRVGMDHDWRNDLSRQIATYRRRFFENRETVREWEHFLSDMVNT